MMEITKHDKCICLECWKRLVAKPGETPPFPSKRMIFDECGEGRFLSQM